MHKDATASHPPALEVKDLHKRFGALEVLKGISLMAAQGDVISLIGSSGSGKSTLLRCINLLEIPNAGHVWVNGELIEMTVNRKGETVPKSSRQVDRIRTKLGMVFQQFNLWTHMTIFENVIEAPVHVLGRKRKEAQKTAMQLLEKVGIADKANNYPAQISGGQQQRAAIARALAMEPTVMLLDEPTSALDPELVGDVLAVIRQLAEEGRTMLIATHEMDFCRDVSTQVIFLDEGRVEEQGPPEKVFNAPDSVRCRQFLSRFLWQDRTDDEHNTQNEQEER
jgi:octopine/nopaline transport system ATP-binding protein